LKYYLTRQGTTERRQSVAPYLVNIKKLTYDDGFKAIKNWLNSCDKVRPLDFNANVKIKYTLRAASRVGYHPMAFSDLESETFANLDSYNKVTGQNGYSFAHIAPNSVLW
jgi:hypothetical protein